MIDYHAEQNVVVMDLFDLEHCGFDHVFFNYKLACRGIEEEDARFPFAIVVNVRGGHVLCEGTTEKAGYQEQRQQFTEWMQRVLEIPYSSTEQMAYIGRAPCGCIYAATLDLSYRREQVAENVAEWIRDGLTVERIPVAKARIAWNCVCPNNGIVREATSEQENSK